MPPKAVTFHAQLQVALLLAMSLWLCPQAFAAEEATVNVGVLAKRGREVTVSRWVGLADYLERRIPGTRFAIVPLEFREVAAAVAENRVDFIFANPGMFVELEHSFGVRPIATVRSRHGERSVSLFSGLIVTRADRQDIRTFDDLRGKRFVAVDRDSLGGWLMARRELQGSGIDGQRHFRSLTFAGTHDGVVRAVLAGEADAGTISSEALDSMEEEGVVASGALRVLHGKRLHYNLDIGENEFPFPHSTDIYPEWPMAKLSRTAEELSRKVAIALLDMGDDDPAARAARIAGWDVARNYRAVHDLYRDLRLGPYRDIDYLRPGDVWKRYWQTIVAAIAFLATLCVLVSVLVRMRFKLLKANQDITRMAMHDPLTQLPNRRFFSLIAENAFAQARREGWKVYVLLIDLDGFKEINDSHGHDVGDEVLRHIGRRLRTVVPEAAGVAGPPLPLCTTGGEQAGGVLRAEDYVARHGGDEFLSILIHVRESEALGAIARRILDSLRQPMEIGGRHLVVGASIGVAVYPDHGNTLDALIRAADVAMYEVKRSGKGSWRLYCPPQNQ